LPASAPWLVLEFCGPASRFRDADDRATATFFPTRLMQYFYQRTGMRCGQIKRAFSDHDGHGLVLFHAVTWPFNHSLIWDSVYGFAGRRYFYSMGIG